MKLILTFILGAVLGFMALAQPTGTTFKQLRTLSGKEYTDASVTAVLPNSIRITHESGTATVQLTDLPEDLQKQFGFDPAKAVAFSKQQAEQEQANKTRAHLNGLKARLDAVVKSSKTKVNLRIISVLPDGILGMRGDQALFVICPSDAYVDGDRFIGEIYQCGTYAYDTAGGARATVLKYAMSVEKATAVLYAEKGIEFPK